MNDHTVSENVVHSSDNVERSVRLSEVGSSNGIGSLEVNNVSEISNTVSWISVHSVSLDSWVPVSSERKS